MMNKDAEDIMQRAVKMIERRVVIDLSARLPYGVKMQVDYHNGDKPIVGTLRRIDYGSADTLVVDTHVEVINESDCALCLINHTKPYLRPILSMTEKELSDFVEFHCVNLSPIVVSEMLTILQESKMLDWLNAHHIDYRQLIEQGLALEAPAGMYNF